MTGGRRRRTLRRSVGKRGRKSVRQTDVYVKQNLLVKRRRTRRR